MQDQKLLISKVKHSLSELEELLTNQQGFSLSTYNSLKNKLNEAQNGLKELGNEFESSLLTFFDKEIGSLEQTVSSLEKEKENLVNHNNQIPTPEEPRTIQNTSTQEKQEEVIEVMAEASFTEELAEESSKEVSDTETLNLTEAENVENTNTEESPATNQDKPISVYEKLSQNNQVKDLNSTLDQKVVFQNLSFDVNDRVYFQNELFNGDPYQFHVSLKKMQECNSFDGLEKLIQNELSAEFDWTGKQEIVSKLLSTVKEKTQ